jgi:hypothetical protein
MTRYQCFDRSKVQLDDVAKRGHLLIAEDCLQPAPPETPYQHEEFPQLVERIATARADDRPVIVMMGAHPIKLGLSRFLIELIGRRVITHLATNGAGLIHDYELATLGGTSEDVARWIREGQFGLWRETAVLNDLVVEAAAAEDGIGEAIGRRIAKGRPAHGELSLAAAAWQTGVPMTVHVALGSDIVHAHPNFNAAAWARASDTDFLIFAESISQLEGGVFLNFGSAVAGPEVYLKALAMSRNLARQQGRSIRRFTTAVFDLVELPDNWREGTPSKEHPLYYYRPWKTLLERTVTDGGTSFYFRGDHRQTIPTLWQEFCA